MNKAYKCRIYLNKEQSHLIECTFGSVRFLYNQMLEERINIYEKLKDNKDSLKNHKYITEKQYKEIYPFLKDVPSRALQQARCDLDSAYKNFYRNIKKGRKPGFPKFKKKGKSRLSYRDPQVGNQIRIIDGKLNLPKLNKVKVRGLPDKIDGIIKSVTVSKSKSGKYFASILVECDDIKKERKSDNIIGVDLGLKEFAICSNGDVFSEIKDFNSLYESKIKKAQKHLSRKKRGSKRYEKQRVNLNILYEKRDNILQNYLWNLVNKLCSENQAISIEDLGISGMKKNRKLSHAIQLIGWGKFVTMLKQKSKEFDTMIYQIDRWFPSSKMCSKCGSVKDDLKLSDRTYSCDCGLIIDRDINAAINIRNVMLNDKKSLEYSDYKRGEVVRPMRLKFDNNGSFVETFNNFKENIFYKIIYYIISQIIIQRLC